MIAPTSHVRSVTQLCKMTAQTPLAPCDLSAGCVEPSPDDRIATIYGIRACGYAGVILIALESRFKASVLQGTGLEGTTAPEIVLRKYARRVRADAAAGRA